MKTIVMLLSLSLATTAVLSQKISREQKAFLDALNGLIANAPANHIENGEPMHADSVFHLNGDTLSITWSYSRNGSRYWMRYAALFPAIKEVVWDDFLVLQFDTENTVIRYERSDQQPEWVRSWVTDILHITQVSSENKNQVKWKEKIEKTLRRLKESEN